MEKIDINYKNMIDTVIATFEAETDVWNTKKPITDALANMKAFSSEIEGLAHEQANNTTQGATITLNNYCDNMTELAMNMILKLRPYSTATQNDELFARIDYTKSDFDRAKQMDKINMSKIVLQCGIENQAEMNGYEFTEVELEALEAAINGVAMLSGNRDAIIGARKSATDAIPELISKARRELDMLDDLVPALVEDYNFVQTYKNNRRIIDR